MLLTIYSISLKSIAWITLEGLCSQHFQEILKSHMKEKSETANYDFDFYELNLSADNGSIQKLNQFFYQLKVSTLSFIILLVPDRFLANIFDIASKYGFTKDGVIWFIPYFNRDLKFDKLPHQVLSYNQITADERYTYTSIPNLVDRLIKSYEENRASFQNQR